jgi:hypothetical protein
MVEVYGRNDVSGERFGSLGSMGWQSATVAYGKARRIRIPHFEVLFL